MCSGWYSSWCTTIPALATVVAAPEAVCRLNQKQDREQIRSPVDGWKCHLRLSFSRGRGKREKYVKLATSPEKISPKWKGSKQEHRNKRLSRAQAGMCTCIRCSLTLHENIAIVYKTGDTTIHIYTYTTHF